MDLVSSPLHWAKNILEMFVIQHTSTWANFEHINATLHSNAYDDVTDFDCEICGLHKNTKI